MLPGFHTAGLLHHDLFGAIEELAALGYRAVAVRPQHGRLSQTDPWFGQQLLRLADVTSRHDLQLILDLDTQFLQKAWTSRGPSLSSLEPHEARTARDWIETWLDLATESQASIVTFASGATGESTAIATESSLTQLALLGLCQFGLDDVHARRDAHGGQFGLRRRLGCRTQRQHGHQPGGKPRVDS